MTEIRLKLRHGIVGDAHAGDWHRQISLMAEESIDSMRPRSPIIWTGVFAENIISIQRASTSSTCPWGPILRIVRRRVGVTGNRNATATAPSKGGEQVRHAHGGIFAVVVKRGRYQAGAK